MVFGAHTIAKVINSLLSLIVKSVGTQESCINLTIIVRLYFVIYIEEIPSLLYVSLIIIKLYMFI